MVSTLEIGAGRRIRTRIPFDWRGTAWAVGAAGLALAVPLLLKGVFGPSAFLFGALAVVVCAAAGGPVSALVAAGLFLAGSAWLDGAGEARLAPQVARGAVFLLLAATVARASAVIRRQRRSAQATLDDLTQQQAVLRSILDTGPDAMLVIDAGGTVSSFSPAAEQLFGWKAAEVVGRNVSMLMPAPYQAEHDGYIGRYLASGERQIIGKSREVKGLRKDGTHFPMMLHVGEVDLGDERQFTGFIHDLTALQDAHSRTQDLQAQLTHVWSMNSLGEMASVLAHELNQPLAAIANYVRGARTVIARMELPDGELLEVVDHAGNQAIRAGEIIRRMRSLISRNDVEHKRESLAELISEADFIVSLVAREANVAVRYNLAEGPDHVVVDRIQIQQVISNLARNAAEAMRDSPARTLDIRTRRAGRDWIVSVEDSGPGVPEEMVDKLFQPMTSSKSQGMGLGLSLSRSIIENHRGQIWVERSRLGGAAFCFNLPGEPA